MLGTDRKYWTVYTGPVPALVQVIAILAVHGNFTLCGYNSRISFSASQIIDIQIRSSLLQHGHIPWRVESSWGLVSSSFRKNRV